MRGNATTVDSLGPVLRAEDGEEVAHPVTASALDLVVCLGAAGARAEELTETIHERVLLPCHRPSLRLHRGANDHARHEGSVPLKTLSGPFGSPSGSWPRSSAEARGGG